MPGYGASFHPVFSVSPSDTWDTPGRRHQNVLVNTSAFVLGQIEVDTMCGNDLPVSPRILTTTPVHSLAGSHSWLAQHPDHISSCLSHYIACKMSSPHSTSALIALPRFYRRKGWHKFLKGMLCVFMSTSKLSTTWLSKRTRVADMSNSQSVILCSFTLRT